MCEQGAKKRGLDLAMAAADAEYWWKTGLVPLRESPLAKSSAPGAGARQPANAETSESSLGVSIQETTQRKMMQCPYCSKEIGQDSLTCQFCGRAVLKVNSPQPSIKASEPVSGKKSPILAGVLSFFLLGGAGQFYLGQWKKGLALILATLILSGFLIGIPIAIIGVG